MISTSENSTANSVNTNYQRINTRSNCLIKELRDKNFQQFAKIKTHDVIGISLLHLLQHKLKTFLRVF